ncbi:MAG: 50S ribosomal protein L3 N(5)-glutamine methyltransferase [Burkholderiales bacterium]|nr:50S ribosomal protein L3 N(5)-glutamine methyltransferase [Burkholderiales bacterium]
MVAALARRFRAARLHFGHGTACARDEAAWLVAHATGVPPASLDPRARIGAEHARRIRALAARRIRERIPLAYLLGEAWLAGRRFYVDRRAIIPRSFISELLAGDLRPWLQRPVDRVLDLGTGSGCLAVLAALAFPKARVDATDVSAEALEVARRNVRRHRLTRRVRLTRSDLFAALGQRRYDLILANPPYVPTRTLRRLPPEYDYEPRLALDGGRDGLEYVRRILAGARRHLAPRGLLVCEAGAARRALERAYPRTPFAWPEVSEPGTVFVLAREALPR